MAASFITRLLASTSLVSNLQQVETNGLSLLGTLAAPQLAPFLQEKVAPGTMPWGGATAKNTNPYTNPPKTGVRRHYDLTISRGTIAPDGVSKAALLINGAFPGPTLEANWGDTFVVRVCNNITGPEEGTALHWHGFLQKGTPFNDGVPAVSQCPIPPGKEYTYVFKADLFGTSWYHSHYSAQYSGGAIGPIVVHGPSQSQYDIDIGPVMLGDYYHADYFSIVQAIETPGFNPPPVSDNNLINGKMNYDCDNTTSTSCTSNAGLSKFSFQSGKTHRLRLINPGSEGMQRFSIDGHTMTVIANDFVPVVPYNTSVVTLAVGQRTDVLVTANLASTSSVWMRSNISQLCSSTRQPFAVAPIYYESADTNATPRSTAWPYTETSCSNDALASTVPYLAYTPPAVPDVIQEINITVGFNASGFLQFFMNGVSFRGNYDHPILLLTKLGNTSYPYDPQWNVFNFGAKQSVRIIVNNPTFNGFAVAHPMHLHGHNFWVLNEGLGTWDGTTINANNPQRRDTQIVQGGGYAVLEYMQDNPGVWPFHCHIAWHTSQGLYSQFIEQPDAVMNLDFPPNSRHTCMDWYKYSSHNVVDQIDSGL